MSKVICACRLSVWVRCTLMLFFALLISFGALQVPVASAAGPEISVTDPITNEVGVALGSNIAATFSTAISSTTVTTGTFAAQGMMSGLITGTYALSDGDTTVTLDPDSDFFAGEVVRTSLTSGIENPDGDPLAPYQWQFTLGPVFARCLGGFVHDQNVHLTAFVSGPIALGDYDNDGHLDIFMSGWDPSHNVARLYHNNGDGTFTHNEHAGLPAVNAGSAEWGDYDNDGDLDMLVTGTDRSAVYRNNGNGTFTNIGAGLQDVSGGVGIWGDYDNDGYLDILLTGSDGSNIKHSYVYHNDSGTGFTRNDTASAVLKDVDWEADGAWGDYDNDGYLDILLTGDSSSGRVTEVYRNTGTGTFTLAHSLPGVIESAVAWGDYDNDGYLDILFNGESDAGRKSELYHNDSGTGFTRNDAASDALTNTYYGGLAWGDYDNDGYLDILLTGKIDDYGDSVSNLYRNNGDGTFTDVNAGLESVYQSAVGFGDFDGDHDMDILLAGYTSESWGTYLYVNTDCPELSIGKWVEPDPVDYHGVVTYTVAVTNTEFTATGVRMTDTLSSKTTFDHWITQNDADETDDVITWSGEVPGVDTVVWSWTVRHTGAGEETVTNTAWYGYDGQAVSDTVTFSVDPPPPLVITKTVTPGSGVDYHGTVTYTVTVFNKLSVPAEGTRLTDTLPAEVDFGDWILQSGAVAVGDVITWTGTVAAGESVVWSWWVTHTGDYDDVVTNTARYTCRGMTRSDSAVFTVNGPPILSFSKSVVPNEDVSYHGAVDYTVQLINTGESPAAGVRLTDTLPAQVDFGDWVEQSGAVEADDVITWSGTVTEETVLTWSWTVTHTGSYGDVVTNTARYDYEGMPEEASATFVVEPLWMRVTATDPVANEAGVAPTTDLTATFEAALGAAVNSTTVTTGTFVAQGMMSGLFTGTYDVDTQTATLNPTRDLFPGEVVRTSLTPGIESTDGAPLTPYQWQITAGPVFSRCVGGFEHMVGASDVLTGVGDSTVDWGDYDNDGDLDILLSGYHSDHEAHVSEVFRNDDGTFTPIGAGLTPVAWSSGAWGDYDNDGDLDILLTGDPTTSSFDGHSYLYRNDGGTFTGVNAGLIGVAQGSVAWGDYDSDGHLDILLTGHNDSEGGVSRVYHNNGDGTFTWVAQLADAFTGTVAWGDYDNDGDLDILLTGDGDHGGISYVYRNDGDGSFNHAHSLTGVYWSSAAWGDYDNDTYLDIVLVGNESDNLYGKLYHNNAGTGFSENTAASAVLADVYTGDVAWGDYDNDGFLDILLTGYDQPNGGSIASRVYHNNGDGTFTDINAGLANVGAGGDTSSAWGDYDNDGDLDILITGYDGHGFRTELYRNDDCYDLSISKWVTPTMGVSYPGIVTYTVAITNAGTVNAAGVRLTDTLPTEVDFLHWVTQTGATELDGEITWTGTVSGYSTVLWSWTTRQLSGYDETITNTARFDHPTSGQSGSDPASYDSLSVMQVTVTDPLTNAVGVALTTGISATLDHAVNPGTVTTETFAAQGMMSGLFTGTYSLSDGDTTVTLNLGRPLFPGELMRTSLTSGMRGTGEEMLIPYQWQFTAGPTFERCIGGFTEDAAASAVLANVAYGSVAWGDYDRDGDLDILLTGENHSGNPVSTVYSNDSGTFTDSGVSLTDVDESSVAWGDFDGDADLDILLMGTTSGNHAIVEIYRNNGNSTFTLLTGTGLPGVSDGSVDWGDYDNDGDLDILLIGTTDGGWTVVSRVYRNNGDGTFTHKASFHDVYDGSAAWGDYDNDGDLDALITGMDHNNDPITRLYRNDFGEFTLIDAGLRDLYGSSVAWGDYDNDGYLDILLAGTGSGVHSRLYHNDRDGTFTDIDAGLKGLRDGSVNWADYDNDGDLDILLAGIGDDYAVYSLLYRNDGGTFTELTASLTGFGDSASAWGDYDNDGDLDVLILGYIGSSTFETILYRNDDCLLTIDKRVEPQSGIELGDAVTYTLTLDNAGDADSTGTELTDRLPAEVDFARWISQSGATYHHGEITWSGTVSEGESITWAWVVSYTGFSEIVTNTAEYENAKTETSSDSATFTAEPFLHITATNPTAHQVGVTRTTSISATFDAEVNVTTVTTGTFAVQGMMGGLLGGTYQYDSSSDTVTFDPARALHAGEVVRSVGTYHIQSTLGRHLAPYQWQFRAGPMLTRCQDGFMQDFTAEHGLHQVGESSVAWGDYDNDGNLDILLTGSEVSKVYGNNGNGTFTDIGASLLGVRAGSAAWGDYDNDGDLDILLTGARESYAGHTWLYRNDGGTFTEVSVGLVDVYWSAVAWGDYDNDGDLDILLTGRTDSGHAGKVYRNDGAATGDSWTFTDIHANIAAVSMSSVDWGDYDNDGDLDILLAGENFSGYHSKVYRNDGTRFVHIDAGLPGITLGAAVWGDYDNDGDLDILLAGVTEGSYISRVYRNNGDGTFTHIEAGLTAVSNASATWGDYDNDGILDILIAGSTGSSEITRVYRNSGTGTFSDIDAGITGVSNGSVAWGDYDNDGDLDILLTGENYNQDPLTELYRNEDCPILSIGKWAEPTMDVDYGDEITYTVSITNPSDLPALGTLMTDTLPVKVDFVRWITQSGAVRSGDTITWTGTVTEYTTLTWSWVVTYAGDLGKTITNTAWYEYEIEAGNAAAAFETKPGPMYVTATDPVTNAVGVPLMADVEATFDHLVDTNTVTTGTFVAQGMMSGMFTGTYGVDTFSATLDPARAFFPGELVRTSLTSGIEGNGGRAVLVPYQWQFTAGPVFERCTGEFVHDISAGESVTAVSDSAVAWGDYDGDGDLDALIAGADAGDTPLTRLYRNDGTGKVRTFTPVTVEPSGLAGVRIGAVKWGDYDNDGDPDILLNGLGSGDVPLSGLYRNDGAGAGDNWTFTPVTVQPSGLTGLGYSTADWGDYDNDGDLDMLLSGQESGGDPLTAVYRNDGAGSGGSWTFGLDVAATDAISDVSAGSVTWGDYTGDGWLDVFVTGEHAPHEDLTKLYRNKGDGTFQEDTAAAVNLPPTFASSADWGDFDRDSDLDLLISGDLRGSGGISQVYRNEDGVFVLFANPFGHLAGTSAWGDYNNDGFLDILLTGAANHIMLLINEDGGGFYEDQRLPGLSASGAAWGDYDGDNDLDILVAGWNGHEPISRFYLNENCAELDIGKWAMPETGVDYHGTVTYTVAISNTGGTITGVELEDSLPDEVDFAHWVRQNGAEVAAGDVVSWTGTVTGGRTITWTWVVTHTGGYGDVVTNTAIYDSDISGGSAKAAFAVKSAPALVIDKAVLPSTNVDVHGVVTYSVQLTNMGPSDAFGTLLTDTLSSEVDFARWVQQSDAIVANDEITWTGTVTHGAGSVQWSWVVTHTGDYGDVVTNTVDALHPDSGQTAADAVTFTVKGPPVLHMEKAVAPDHDVVYRAPVTYTITMSNTGQSPAAGVWMTDPLGSEMEFMRWVNRNGANVGDEHVTWNGTISPSQVISWSWVMSQHFGYAFTVQNTARWEDSDRGASGDATTSFTVEGPPVVAMVKSVTPEHDVPYHSTVTYTIGMTNTGGLAYDMEMYDPLWPPPVMEFAGWVQQNGAVHDTNAISWTGTMSRGTSLWWSWVMTQNFGYGITAQNTARWEHADSGGSGTAEAEFTVQGPPVLSIGKWVTPDSEVGYHDEITYTVTISNSGGAAAGTRLTDTLPSEVDFVSWVQQHGADVTGDEITWSGTASDSSTTFIWVTRYVADHGGTVTNTAEYDHPDSGQGGSAEAVFTTEDTPPEPPALVSPPDGAYIDDNTPTMTWVPSPSPDAAGYWLDFNGTPLDVGDTTRYTTTVLADGTYTWTVAAYDGLRNTSAYTDVWTFTVDTVRPDPPVLVSPPDSAVISDTTPALTWLASPSADVTGYDLDFDGTPLDVGDVTAYTTTVLADGTYTWTVNAYDLAHNTSPYTDTWSFRVDTTGPSVIATSPVSNATGVSRGAPVVVTFDEPVISETVTYAVVPDPGGWAAQWDAAGRVVTLTHEEFDIETWYTATVLTAVDPVGNPMAGPYSWSFRVVNHVYYFPIVMKKFVSMPDLVVSITRVTAEQVEVVVTNVGSEAVRDDFWVDVSFNPRFRPPRINQPWNTIAEHGIVWGVRQDLPPNVPLILKNHWTDPNYFFVLSSQPPLPVGEDVYVYVDSVDYSTTWGTVREGNEGNNTAGPVVSVAGQGVQPAAEGRTPSLGDLPSR